MSTFTPLHVTAHLAHGLAQAAPWGIALDGLLAAELWADYKAARRDAGDPTPKLSDTATPADLPLPLARCTLDPDAWHWAATCALPQPTSDTVLDVRYWTGRLDHRAAAQLTNRMPAAVSTGRGRYRARHMPVLVSACAAVTWRAVGDPDTIERLLTPLQAIGKKRSIGEGHVLSWDVTPLAEVDEWSASHLHPDGTLGRTAPDACLQHNRHVATGGHGTAGLRPPYVHPQRQQPLHLPALLDT